MEEIVSMAGSQGIMGRPLPGVVGVGNTTTAPWRTRGSQSRGHVMGALYALAMARENPTGEVMGGL